ncbi:uncharacterized protein E5676_scaffold1333G00270 [Cucumis melo var. makuwa]|uniref:Uncharacterized protein n=1 Tax=Cucumis melo var. makuwa TaxID=1194695 RepID=A0A5A7TWA5_CUCMM|nr:uncharacterized protein E6C27_scaffold376G00360 [Cucumis melo var. makuwa]TYK00206.1 uncharacterized protein E5676_scaffold1333G00270 [Cucumis melo var. makuwa]
MEPRGRSRRVRKLATDVPAIESINREQASNEISSNLYYLVGRRAGEGMNYRLPLKLDKRFGIKRLKALWVMTFTRTTNQEYEKRFTELAKYALAFITNEMEKCEKFEEGLQTEI